MNDEEYRRARSAFLRDGVLPESLHGELVAVARQMVRRRVLPPVYSPYGQWNEEAVDEVAQAWIAHRLLGAGQLRPLIARAGELFLFRGRAERSLRQFLVNERDRSQAQNLFVRIRGLLEEDTQFRCFIAAQRPQDRWYGLDIWDQRPVFDGDERRLRGAAWSVGELTVVRYRADARKLSPVLDALELHRFMRAVFETLCALLRPGHFLEALSARFPLEDTHVLPFENVAEPANTARDPVDAIALGELAVVAIAELTARQATILLRTAEGRTLEEMALQLGCARATVLNEQRRAGAVITRLSGTDTDRAELLNVVVDLLYGSEQH